MKGRKTGTKKKKRISVILVLLLLVIIGVAGGVVIKTVFYEKVGDGVMSNTEANRLISYLGYEYKKAQLDSVMEEIESLCKKIPESEQMLAIKGIGVITVAGFLAEVGDVRRFESPRQIQKLAGLSLRENSSGKHKGQTTISKRGRSKLRAVLFNAAIPLIAKNPEFRSLHEYYTTRANNPLKKKQSVIAISCKLIRVFYAILSNGVTYDPQKMLSDIHRPSQAA